MAKKARRPAKRGSRSKTSARRPRGPSPVPAGFGTVTPYLVIDGAAKALDWYKQAFGAREMSRSPVPGGKLMHARVKIGDSIVMMSDEFPGSQAHAPTAVGTTTVTLHVYSRDVEKLWNRAVAAGAKVDMPLEDQFWGERYGQIVDPFGHRWSLSQRVKMSKAEREAKQREAMAAFGAGEHPGPESSAAQGSPPG